MVDHEVNGTFIGREPVVPTGQQDDQGNGQAPPSDTESEEHQESPSPPSAPVLDPIRIPPPFPVPVQARHEPSSDVFWRYARQIGFQSFLWLQLVWSLLSQAGSVAQSVTTGVLRGLQSQVYVFFQGSTYPYRLFDYTLTGPGVPAPEWFYDADKKIFYSSTVYNTTTEYELHHFEWLSGHVRYNNLILYDVSEYLQQIKWVGRERPSAAHVLAAWAIHSGVVLTLLDGITLSTINEDASESNVPLRG